MTTAPDKSNVKAISKTDKERAEDIAYTLNHSVYCTLTDFLNPPINAATDNYLRWLFPGCGHHHAPGEHGHDHHNHDHACSHDHHAHDHSPNAHGDHHSHNGHDHSRPSQHVHHCEHHGHAHEHRSANANSRWKRVKQATRYAFSKERFIEYAKGEFIGDFSAVPLTIGVQRYFPGFMASIQDVTEPLVRPLFRWGINRSTAQWAKAHGIDNNSQEVKDQQNKIYNYEISHFPQAIVWTGFSLGINTAYQMTADKTPIAFLSKLSLKGASVLSGVLVTAGVVVAARALVPGKMQSLDDWTSEHAVLPATKAIGGLFGVKHEDVDRMTEKKKNLDATPASWTKHIESEDNPHETRFF